LPPNQEVINICDYGYIIKDKWINEDGKDDERIKVIMFM